ncbi:MAG: hypothetical protein OER88_00800, partial [Planctomycetota bacterium]|nr:hypothetical protein [Planctomycetota bacterium]
MGDWGDERRNMNAVEFKRYLWLEYAVFALIQDAQRAFNASLPGRKGLAPLVHLAVIRHTANTRAAISLAQTQGADKALALLKKHLPKGMAVERAPPADVRRAAGRAARAVLGAEPPEWPGFTFDPGGLFSTIEQAKDLVR